MMRTKHTVLFHQALQLRSSAEVYNCLGWYAYVPDGQGHQHDVDFRVGFLFSLVLSGTLQHTKNLGSYGE